MALSLYNTLTRRLEPFNPLNPPHVTMYVCGPTVYGHSHLGHAKSYISFDVVLRWLRFSGYDVTYVQNITDVGHMTDNDEDAGQDKLVLEARRRSLHPMAVAEAFTRSFYDDMDALNVLRPDIAPRATGHITEQIECARRLISAGHAYEANGSVYFSVRSFPRYGKLSGRQQEDMEAGARVAVNDEKRDPADFALWKRAEPGHIMRWLSPWGEGFPGWHLECSVMAQKYLGQTIDIHGGGLENQFPHHECEIAQAEALTGKPFARYWLHNNMVTLNGRKMGKSLGNAISLKDVFHAESPLRDRDGNVLLARAFLPEVVRHFVLTSHYRQTLDFSQSALEAAESGTKRLRDAAAAATQARRAREGDASHSPESDAGAGCPLDRLRREIDGASPDLRAALNNAVARFTEAMNDDFNTAAAVAVLFEWTRQTPVWVGADSSATVADLRAVDAVWRATAGEVLGLRWRGVEEAGASGDRRRSEALVTALLDLRRQARESKNFALSDQIRDQLAAAGVELRDGPQGTSWSFR